MANLHPDLRPKRRDPHTSVLKTLLSDTPFQVVNVSNPHAAEIEGERKPARRTWQWATPQIEGRAPCARGGHTATLIANNANASAQVVVFGGQYSGEVSVFDTACSVAGGGGLDASAGRVSVTAGGQFVYLNDVHVLDVDQNTWSSPQIKGTAPLPRYGHTGTLVGSRIVYFGGRGVGAQSSPHTHYRDLHALDTTSMTWYQGPASGGAPTGRMGHTANLYNAHLYVYGGVGSGCIGGKYFGEVHELDLASMCWSEKECTGPGGGGRYGHGSVLVENNLVVHGGFSLPPIPGVEDNGSGAAVADDDLGRGLQSRRTMGNTLREGYLADIRVLNLDEFVWSRLRTSGAPPSGRFGHSMVVSGADVIVFGGWAGKPQAADNAIVTKKAEDGSGEGDGFSTSKNLMTLRTTDMSWENVEFAGATSCPGGRYLHSCTTIGPHSIIFGGFDGGKPLNELVVLRETTGSTQEQGP